MQGGFELSVASTIETTPFTGTLPCFWLLSLKSLHPFSQSISAGEPSMPQTPHTETHFTGGELVRDIVIGMSDGLTVPFAPAAGLAEIAAGSIAMGLAAFLPREATQSITSRNSFGKKEKSRPSQKMRLKK